jgi:hypothetical protein
MERLDQRTSVTTYSNELITLEIDRINLQIAREYELSNKTNVFTKLIEEKVKSSTEDKEDSAENNDSFLKMHNI